MRIKHLVIKSLSAAIALALASSSFASGFQLFEQSAAGTGDYHAGGAAEADDASTEFYNPAGMVRLKHQQLSAGGVYIPLRVNFKGDVTSFIPLDTHVKDANGGTDNLVPNVHYALPLPHGVAVGFGVTVPFGLKTQYSQDNPIKAAATLTQLQTININPNIAYAINNHLSVGAGFNAQHASAEFDGSLMSENYTNSFSGWGYGYNLGLLYQFNTHSRVGLSYRSKIHYNAKGTGTLGLGAGLTSQNITSALTLPATTTLSFYQEITSQWAAMATVSYTQWKVIQNITIKNTPAGGDITVPYHYRNTFNFALGVHYKVNHTLLLKAGAGFDQTPTSNQYRDVRMPDMNRIAIAIGAQMTVNNHLMINVGWIHLFTKDAPIDNPGPSASTAALPEPQKGTAKTQANVFGLQFTWTL